MKHETVLLAEAIANLAIQESGKYVDATFGRGGHSRAILEKLGPNGRLIAIDRDPAAIAVAKQAPFSSDTRFEVAQSSFSSLEEIISKRGWLGNVNGVLLDLGVSSPQLDDPQRGFSFLRDGPLDMRVNPEQGIDAMTWVNQASASEIADVLFQFGEERFSRRIARGITFAREKNPITTTMQLAKIIEKSNPKKDKHKHPATRSFQAIRIFINQELTALQNCLPQIVNVLSTGGRMCVISFHSLEDRMVKQFVQHEASNDTFPSDMPMTKTQIEKSRQPRLKKVGKAIEASEEEIKFNPRARSARLRVAERM